MSNQKLLTICIVHYRKLPQLKRTIQSIKKGTSAPYKIKILNNGYEKEGIKKYLSNQNNEKNIEVIFNKENIGCSPGRNIVTRDIKTPFIMMLDDDMYVSKNWDKDLFKMFKNKPNVGAIGFSIFKTDGTFWVTGGRNIITNGNVIRIERTNINPKKTRLKFLEVNDVAAGAMIYRSELSKIINWDPGYFIGFEDLEKGLNLKKNNYRCLVSIQSKFIHDKISVKNEYVKYNDSRRDYHAYRKSYLYFIDRNKYRLDMKRHLFYKYFCLLPNWILQKIAYFWLDKI
jgi:GT2 family glycosyltransferase